MVQHHDVLGRVYRPEDAGLTAAEFDAAIQRAADAAEQQYLDDPMVSDLATAELARQYYYDDIGYGGQYRQARDIYREIAQQYGYEEEVQARMVYGSEMTADRYANLRDSVTRDEENRLMMDFAQRGFELSDDDRATHQRYTDRTADREFPSVASGISAEAAVGHRSSQPDEQTVAGEREKYREHEQDVATLGQQLKGLTNFQVLQVMSQEIIRRVRHDVAEFKALYEQWRNPGAPREYPQESAFGDFDPEVPSTQPSLEERVTEHEPLLKSAASVQQRDVQEHKMQPQSPKPSGIKAGRVVEGFRSPAPQSRGPRTLTKGQSAGMPEHMGQPRKLSRQHRSLMNQDTQQAMDAYMRGEAESIPDQPVLEEHVDNLLYEATIMADEVEVEAFGRGELISEERRAEMIDVNAKYLYDLDREERQLPGGLFKTVSENAVDGRFDALQQRDDLAKSEFTQVVAARQRGELQDANELGSATIQQANREHRVASRQQSGKTVFGPGQRSRHAALEAEVSAQAPMTPQDHQETVRENRTKQQQSKAAEQPKRQRKQKPKDPHAPKMSNMDKFQIASKTVTGAVMGAKTGTAVGRSAGPWGTAIGGAAGAIAGGADGFKSGKSEFEKAQQRLQQSLEAHGHTPEGDDKDRGPAGPSLA